MTETRATATAPGYSASTTNMAGSRTKLAATTTRSISPIYAPSRPITTAPAIAASPASCAADAICSTPHQVPFIILDALRFSHLPRFLAADERRDEGESGVREAEAPR